MGVKRSDFAIRDEKDAMLRAVNDIKARYKMIDDAEWTLSKVPAEVRAILNKYSNDLKRPMVKFFAGDVMEQIAAEAHDSFIKAIDNYISTRKVELSRQISERLVDSLRGQIVRNIDGFMTDMDANLYQRAEALRTVAAENIAQALPAQLGLVQLKIESITARTTGREDIQQAWKDLTDKYGSRETVKYRDGKNYPLNTYLEGRANTTATDVHLATTQLDAAQSGIYTGMISKHGASDSCRVWEGKIICFSSEGREMLAKSYPVAAQMKTLEEVRNDSGSHIFKFNCRHTVTPYPVQFFDAKDAESLLSGGSSSTEDVTPTRTKAPPKRDTRERAPSTATPTATASKPAKWEAPRGTSEEKGAAVRQQFEEKLGVKVYDKYNMFYPADYNLSKIGSKSKEFGHIFNVFADYKAAGKELPSVVTLRKFKQTRSSGKAVAAMGNGVFYLSNSYKETEALATATKMKEIGFWSSGSKDHVIHHEMGHFLHDKSAQDSFNHIKSHRYTHTTKDEISQIVSKYASTNPLEFVAEVHAGLKAGVKYPEHIMTQYIEFRGPI